MWRWDESLRLILQFFSLLLRRTAGIRVVNQHQIDWFTKLRDQNELIWSGSDWRLHCRAVSRRKSVFCNSVQPFLEWKATVRVDYLPIENLILCLLMWCDYKLCEIECYICRFIKCHIHVSKAWNFL